MKYVTVILLCLVAWIQSRAQTGSPEDKIYIQVIQPQRNEIPQEASKQLELLLKKMVSANGIMEHDPNNRFVLTSKSSVLSKDIMPGVPSKVSMKIDFTFMVGDIVENKVFESVSISCIGIGINENKAYIAAINSIKPRNKELVDFLTDAKRKVSQYYSDKSKDILRQAEASAAKRDYPRAIYLLSMIPTVCADAEECQNRAIQYHKEYLELRAGDLLNQAKAHWAESPNERGAKQAAALIEQIPVGTSYQKNVDKLISEISAKLKADETREWNFKMEKYHDQVEKQKRDDAARLEQQRADNELRAKQQSVEQALRVEQQRADNAARKQEIEASRQVGLEWAKNQPKEVTYQNNILLW